MFVQLKDVWFKYSHTDWILKGISMKFGRGIFAIVGPNGSGKTTILRVICGFLKPRKGSVFVLGRKVQSYKDVIGKVIYVPTNPTVFVIGPIVYNEFMKISKTLGLEKSIDEIFEELNIKELRNRRIFNLSEGQLRLVSIALVAFSKVNVLLLDEPTVGLDRVYRDKIMEIFKQIKNKAVIIATNDLRLATRVDYVYAINEGQVISEGSPSKVFYDEKVIEVIGAPEIVAFARRIGLSGVLTPQQLAEILREM